jgi:hypothetical protein
MRAIIHPRLVVGRVRAGPMATADRDGHNGAFHVAGPRGARLVIIANDALERDARGWEHVSVSLSNRCPNWPEMCFVKDLFWEDEEIVFQLHPSKSEWINNYPYCLHLWRNVGIDPPTPPGIFVGRQEYGDLEQNPDGARRAIRDYFS